MCVLCFVVCFCVFCLFKGFFVTEAPMNVEFRAQSLGAAPALFFYVSFVVSKLFGGGWAFFFVFLCVHNVLFVLGLFTVV